MNIFVLDKSPIISAQMQCDKHIVKMPLETAQMLCSVWHRYGQGMNVPYKEAHKNHPCTLWAGDSLLNYNMGRHGTPHPQCMPDEYKCIRESGYLTEQMSSQYGGNDTVLAYRRYYVNDKKDIAKWNKSRPMPDWYTDETYKVELVA